MAPQRRLDRPLAFTLVARPRGFFFLTHRRSPGRYGSSSELLLAIEG